MTRILQFKDLGVTSLVVWVVRDDLVSTFRAKEVSVSKTEGDWEINVWVSHTIWSMHVVLSIAEKVDSIRKYNLSFSLLLDHLWVVDPCDISFLLCPVRVFQDLSKLPSHHSLEET